METKICFKCGVDKPLSKYYQHPRMSDGHLNKCKECTKSDVKLRHESLAENVEYIEKERKRGREKYHRLGYKKLHKSKHAESSNTRRHLRFIGIDLKNKEIHHWNYNLKDDVFIVSPRAHKLIHKYITFDEETKRFKYAGELLSTKGEHFNVIKHIFDCHKVNYEIDSYPENNL